MTSQRMLPTLLAAVAAVLLAAPPSHAASGNLFTLTGTGTAGFSGDGGRASGAQVNAPGGMAELPDGSILFADGANHRVRRIGADGRISTVAGTGTAGSLGDGGQATGAQLVEPADIALMPDGGFLVADVAANRVRKVGSDGAITTVAGTGAAGFSGDGGSAAAAQINGPAGVAAAPDGGFLISDTENDRVRRVGPDGTIRTIAGTGAEGFAGDGGAATAAQLHAPYGLAMAADGTVLVADRFNQRIRRIDPGGAITTVAGRETFGGAGDGGPATAASFDSPSDVELAPRGGFVTADQGTDRVRLVAADGRVTTLAGRTNNGPVLGSGAPASLVALENPGYIAVTRDGGVLVSELFGHRVNYVDAGLKDAEPGPQGPAGTPGPSGSPGAPGAPAAPFDRLLIAAVDDKLRAKPKASMSLRYVATREGLAQVELKRGRKSVARKAASAKSGRNAVKLRAPAKPGTYRLALVVRSADGQSATDAAALVVTKPRRR